MFGYYVVRDSKRHWLVKFSLFGGNSEIVATFDNAASARAHARKLNHNLEERRKQAAAKYAD